MARIEPGRASGMTIRYVSYTLGRLSHGQRFPERRDSCSSPITPIWASLNSGAKLAMCVGPEPPSVVQYLKRYREGDPMRRVEQPLRVGCDVVRGLRPRCRISLSTRVRAIRASPARHEPRAGSKVAACRQTAR